MKQKMPQLTSTAHAKVSFYTALNGYIEVFSPTPNDMLGKSYSDRTAEGWLKIAKDFAFDSSDGRSQSSIVLEQVKKLVSEKKYSEARLIVQKGINEANAEIRRAS